MKGWSWVQERTYATGSGHFEVLLINYLVHNPRFSSHRGVMVLGGDKHVLLPAPGTHMVVYRCFELPKEPCQLL